MRSGHVSELRERLVALVLTRREARQLRARLRATEPEGGVVFVLGSPRSGTTFMAGAIGALPGFVDLGEVRPLKRELERLSALEPGAAAAELRRIIERIRRLGGVSLLRVVEQTPETSFLSRSLAIAYSDATVVHMLRDGRDVVCSLMERGWLADDRAGQDDAHLPFGSHPRFWVEPSRLEEFSRASEATRCAWAWRRYNEAAELAAKRLLIRYEDVVGDRAAVAANLASTLCAPRDAVDTQLADAHGRSIGRWRTDLDEQALHDVEREAGDALRRFGYETVTSEPAMSTFSGADPPTESS